MGLTEYVLKSVLVTALMWGGCSYLDRKVDSIDKKIEYNIPEDEKKSIRLVLKENPKLIVNSVRVALDEGYVKEIVKEIPRKKLVEQLNEGLTLGEKLYVVKEFADYELVRACNGVYDTIERRVRK